MRTTVASLAIPLTLLLTAAGCGGDDTCPPGSMPLGERCVASDAGETTDAEVDGSAGDLGLRDGGEEVDGGRVDGGTDGGQDACVSAGAETCNGIDDDCNGMVDDGLVAVTHYADGDVDGFGDDASMIVGCAAPAGRVIVGGDCNDFEAAVRPGVVETCNRVDDDCDAMIDEGLPLMTFYADVDGDGYGVTAMSMMACSAPSGYAPAPGDCNDGNSAVSPGLTEICNSVDDDCSGVADIPPFVCTRGATVPCTTTCGTTGTGACSMACAIPAAAMCTPPAEICNYADDDCDGLVDDGVTRFSPATETGETAHFNFEVVSSPDGFISGRTPTTGGLFVRELTNTNALVGASDTTVVAGTTSVLGFDMVTIPPVAVGGVTHLLVAWADASGILRAARFNASTLASAGPAVMLVNSTAVVSDLEVAATATNILVAYRANSQIDFIATAADLTGITTGTLQDLTETGSVGRLDLAVARTTRFVLVYEDGGTLAARLFGPTGTALDTAVTITTGQSARLAVQRGFESGAIITRSTVGVAYVDGGVLRFRTYDVGTSGNLSGSSAPMDIDTMVQLPSPFFVGYDSVGLTYDGRWIASYLRGASADATQLTLAYAATLPVAWTRATPDELTFMGTTSALTSDQKDTEVASSSGRVIVGSARATARSGARTFLYGCP